MEPVARISLLLLIGARAACTDWKTGLISNRLSFAGAVSGLMLGALFDGLRGVLFSLLGLLIVALPPLILFYRNAMGGGDVKLFGAVGSIAGVSAGMEIQMLSYLLGGAAGVAMWIRRGVVRTQLQYMKSVFHPFRRGQVDLADATHLRFAPCIFAAAVLVCARGLIP